MKQLTLTLIIGVLIFIGCEDKNSNDDNQTQGGEVTTNDGEEVTTHDIDAAGASGFYYDFSSGTEVDSSSSWHISFQMIPVVFGQSTYMMPSLVLGGTVYAAEYSNVTFDELEETPNTFMSDLSLIHISEPTRPEREVIQYDMQSHTVSINNPNRVYVIYENTNHTTYKIQFIEYVNGVILFKYDNL